MVQLEVIYVRHLYFAYLLFFFEKPLDKNTFFKSFSKKTLRLWISKIQIWIWSEECGFYGFMIRFSICPKKGKIHFWIRKSGFGFSQKKRTLKVNLLLTSYLRVLWRKCLRFCSLCFFTDAHFHIGIAASISHLLTAAI